MHRVPKRSVAFYGWDGHFVVFSSIQVLYLWIIEVKFWAILSQNLYRFNFMNQDWMIDMKATFEFKSVVLCVHPLHFDLKSRIYGKLVA